MDHISDKGSVGSVHHGLVHKSISTQEAMKIPEVKAAANQELEKLKKLPGWSEKEVKSKTEVAN